MYLSGYDVYAKFLFFSFSLQNMICHVTLTTLKLKTVHTAPVTDGQHLYKSTQRQPFCIFPMQALMAGSRRHFFFSCEYNRHERKKGSLIYFCYEPWTSFSMKKHHRENTTVFWRSNFSSKFFFCFNCQLK